MANEAEVVDAEVVPTDDRSESGPVSVAVATRPAPTMSVAPQVQAEELGQRLAVIKTAMQQEMTKDVDYGVIPGTSGKPSLFKPGAEKLSVLFQLDVQLEDIKTWGPGEHLTVESKATVYHAPTGQRLGFGEGLCTTREKKYGKRQAQRVCPACGAAAIVKGREEYGGGWVCFEKKGGCKAKYGDGDQRIEGQEVGEVDNPDLPDMWNTVIKMAGKRARVDAILSVTGASALFTQDLEDGAPSDRPSGPETPGPSNGKRYGEVADAASLRFASAAMVELCGGDQAVAAKKWADLCVFLDGYMPAGAALAIRSVAKIAASQRRTGEQQQMAVDQTQVAAMNEDQAASSATDITSDVEALENQVLELWGKLETPEKALKRVRDVDGNVKALQALKAAANRAIRQTQEQQAVGA